MRLYYKKDEYVADGSIAISTWMADEECGGMLVPYGPVTVCLAGYGKTPDKGHVYMPTYKMTPEYRAQVLKDIAEEIVCEIPIGYGSGLYVKLKKDWEKNVWMLGQEVENDN